MVVGLSQSTVDGVLRGEGIEAQIRVYSPPVTLACGFAKKGVLESKEMPREFVRQLVPLVLGLWAIEAVLFLLVVASFLLHWAVPERWMLVLFAVVFGLLCIAASVVYLTKAQRRGDTTAVPEGVDIGAVLLAGEGTVLAIAILLAAFLVLFVLFVVWLPILLIVIAAFSLGELWRDYRTVWIGTDSLDRLGRAGSEFLRRGAALSKSWDPHLAEVERVQAAAIRRAHYRVHASFAGLGVSSLGLVAAGVLSKAIPHEIWFLAVVVAVAAATASVAILGSFLYRRKQFRGPP
jgi:hypothetical protein